MAEKTEFLQAIDDAILDADSLERFINGSDSETVLTRLSAEYPTLQKAIKELFENGGIAGRFKTLTELQSSSLVDGAYALVADDAVDKNGIYIKEAGAWVKSDYDPLMQAKTYTDVKSSEVLNAANKISKDYIESKTAPLKVDLGKAIIQWVDAAYNIVGAIDENAGLHLVGLDDTVQNEIKNVKSVANLTSNIANFTHTFTDDNDQVLAAIGKDGGIYGTGSSISLQEHMGLHGRELSEKTYTAKDLFTTGVDRYVTNMLATHQQYAPMPFGMLPQNYTVPDSIVSNLTLPNATDFIPIDTPYGINDMVVHPYVAEIKGGFRGYRYIMCITPYTVEAHENPVIYGANDFNKWEMLTGFEQPLAVPEPNRFLSDNGLCYNPNTGELVCYWRNSEQVTSEDSILYYRATRDGIEWTDAKVMLSADPSSLHISPSVVFNPVDGLFHLWLMEGGGTLRHYTAPDLDDNWTQVSSQLLAGLWHCEVKWVGDKYMLLVNVSGTRSNFYFAISSDGDTWTGGTDMLTPDPDHVYKASFLPKIVGETIAFDVFYTTNHADFLPWKRRFFHLTTNFVALGA